MLTIESIRAQVGKPQKNKRVIGCAVARMGSDRFPGKVILPLAGKPVWWHVMQRMEAAAKLAGIELVANCIITGANAENDILQTQCEFYGYDCIRTRDEYDIPGGCIQAMDKYNSDVHLGASCDGPFEWFDEVPAFLRSIWTHNYCSVPHWRYGSRSWSPNSRSVFNVVGAVGAATRWNEELAKLLAVTPEDHRAAGLPGIRNPELVRLIVPPSPDVFYQPHSDFWDYYRWYRLEVDNFEDGVMAEVLYDKFYKPGQVVDARECIKWIDAHPEYHYNKTRAESAVNQFVNAKQTEIQDELWLYYCEDALVPKDARKVYCWSCGQFMGYIERSHGIDQLHCPDGSIVTGHARLACTKGHFRVWQHTMRHAITAGSLVEVEP